MTTHKEENFTIKGVVFDMDGLLLDSEALAMDALVEASAELGYTIPIEFFYKMIGVPGDTCRKLVVDNYGRDFPVEDLFRLQESILEKMSNEGKLNLKAGAIKLLDALDEGEVPYAVATSSYRSRAHHHLAAVGIKDRFAHIVTRDDVSQGKPHPEPYETALRLLGVRAEEALAFEDSTNGVRSAHSAKIKVIQIPDLLGTSPEVQDLVYRILPTLSDVLKEPSLTFDGR